MLKNVKEICRRSVVTKCGRSLRSNEIQRDPICEDLSGGSRICRRSCSMGESLETPRATPGTHREQGIAGLHRPPLQSAARICQLLLDVSLVTSVSSVSLPLLVGLIY